jgi:quercetin dioxygenase-like cupin family protein
MIPVPGRALAALFFVSAIAEYSAQTQSPGTRRVELQRHDLAIPGREAIQVRVEFDPGAAFGRHSHPGEELVYVIEGTLEYQLGDAPPVTLRAGEVLFVPAGTVHSARNGGGAVAAELATYLVDKGKPLLTVVE